MAAADATDNARPRREAVAATSTWRARLDELSRPSGLLLLSALVIAALPVTSHIRDPDFWWHLRTGQLILDNSWQLLGTDPYTYTAAGHHWTMHEWLTEVLFALLYRATGGLGLIVLILSTVTWLGVLCLFLRARLGRPNRVVLSLGILFGVVAGYPIWGPRAQMITFALSCLLLYLVERYLRCGGRALWALPPLFLLWSNLHSGFVIGLGFAVVVVASEAAGRYLGFADPASMARVLRLLLVILGCAVVAMINPNGPAIVLYPFATVDSPAQQALILEWHSPDFHGWEVRGYAVMLASLLVMICVNRRLRARDAGLVAVSAALAFQSVRNVALFVAAATPVWIDQLSLLLETRRLGSDRPRRLPPLRPRLVVLAVVALLLAAFYAGGRLLPAMAVTANDLSYARDYPVCASRWLAAAPRSLRIFNQYGEGGYLTWSLAGTGDKVFIFGDAALMGDGLLYTYGDVEAVRPDWEAILTRFGTDVVLFDTGTPLARVISQSPRWVKVYEDAHNQAFVARERQPLLRLPAQPALSTNPADPCVQLAAQGLGPP